MPRRVHVFCCVFDQTLTPDGVLQMTWIVLAVETKGDERLKVFIFQKLREIICYNFLTQTAETRSAPERWVIGVGKNGIKKLIRLTQMILKRINYPSRKRWIIVTKLMNNNLFWLDKPRKNLNLDLLRPGFYVRQEWKRIPPVVAWRRTNVIHAWNCPSQESKHAQCKNLFFFLVSSDFSQEKKTDSSNELKIFSLDFPVPRFK